MIIDDNDNDDDVTLLTSNLGSIRPAKGLNRHV